MWKKEKKTNQKKGANLNIQYVTPKKKTKKESETGQTNFLNVIVSWR